MIEVYAFLAMFTLQVLVLSIFAPAAIVKRIRAFLTRYPAERFPQLYDHGSSIVVPRINAYRTLNWLAAAAGLILLAWLYTYMHRPDWDDGPIEALQSVYLMVQFIPLVLLAVAGAKTNQRLRNAFPEDKRKATLRPRRLFDFVSPFAVFLAGLGYVLFVVFAIYIDQNPFPGFAGAFVNIAAITALYAVIGFVIYTTLYGRKSNPLQTRAGRMNAIGTVVKLCTYVCLGSVVFLSLNFTLVLFDLQNWEPLAGSVSHMVYALLFLSAINAPPPEINLDALAADS
jgi:magnesium-transporting ATPase (P-type)